MPRKEFSVLPYLWMLFASLCFASMSALVHALGVSVSSHFIVLVRSLIVLIVLLVITKYAGVQLFIWKPAVLWLRSVAGTLGTLTCFYAMTKLPVADAITIIHMFPLWVALLSWPLFGVLPNPGVWISITCGITGVVLLHPPHFEGVNIGTLAAVIGSFAAAVALTGLHMLRGIDSRAIVIHFTMVLIPVSFLTLLVSTWKSGFTVPTDYSTWSKLLGVGGFATCGQIAMTKAFTMGPPARVAVVALSQVAIAMLYDMIFWKRVFQATTLVGILLIVAPTMWIMLRDTIRNSG